MRSSEVLSGPWPGEGTVASDRGLPRGLPRRPTTSGYGGGDRGAVTAEAAVVIPVLVAFAMALLWALMAASDQIRCVDAARAGARAAARSEPEAAVLETARDAAPHGARVEVGRAGDLWHVRVESPTPGPGVLALTLSAEAAALAEDTVGGAAP
ncbi:TadE family type IV pilus minor pilin [Streptomyces sp. rh34]|uniref:TadE family type IV pilus minor pilin n=1 Tax=Streptomyces sp. rh34 TaxID=2034272 RepID=UPI000BF07900|nr:TadE family type IV pilus minor pilin [Streptomyces sp. rh34]